MQAKHFCAAVIGVATAIGLSAPASAQTAAPSYGLTGSVPGVCVVNTNGVVAQSSVGKAMQARMQQLGAQVNAELNPEATAIQTEQKSLQEAARAATTAAQRQALEPRLQAFQTRGATLEQKVNQRNSELRATEQKALAKIAAEAMQAVRTVGNSRSCGIVLDAGSVAEANPAQDITAATVTALNGRMSTITFNRETLAAPAARPAQ